MLERHIGDYHFVADRKTGRTLRWGKTLKENPTFAPVPELADISISNHCSKGCSFCYRNSKPNNEFMSLENYYRVLDSLNHPEYGNVFQVALGGGEPLEHPNFREIIDVTYEQSIVPNFTTNGLLINESLCQFIAGKVGAVAISVASMADLDREKLNLLVKYNIKANIHYVLSNKNFTEASGLLQGKYNEQLTGVNAIVFLTYKPAGRASEEDIIRDGNDFHRFVELIDCNVQNRPRIGFDACFVPMLLRYTKIRPELVDSCEGAFFSVYIDHNLNVSPCSFSGERDLYSLHDFDFYEIWNDKFSDYRKRNARNCTEKCNVKEFCHGRCPYYPQITICHV